MIPDRVYVVTIVESRSSVTRCQFACGTAQDFLAWIVSKGRTASLRIGPAPERSEEEKERAAGYAQRFVHETGLFREQGGKS